MLSLDPVVSLAFAVKSAPGVYVPVLGSGVSRAAQIPTGWEILLDLTRKVAAGLNEDPGDDPVRWYVNHFGGQNPDYSSLLEAVAKTPSERNLLLRRYFEPKEDERASGAKVPTAAHSAIARMAARGHVRIIVTTNFDRLMESALEAVGVQPQVISTTSHLAGALPTIHATCTVVKVNGDYLDTRLRNTTEELGRYDRPMTRFLQRTFEDHGLIICGWSGAWDVELRRALESTANRRFTTYWCLHGTLSPEAQSLIRLRGLTTLPITSADEFFTSLVEKIEALEATDQPHPLSARIASSTVKRLLPSRENEIRLSDLISQESVSLAEGLADEMGRRLGEGTVPLADVRPRVRQYESRAEILASMLGIGGFWGSGWSSHIWTRSLNIVAQAACHPDAQSRSVNLIRYPVLYLHYAAGVAAMAAHNFSTLFGVLVKPENRRSNRSQPLLLALDASDIFKDGELAQALRENQSEYTPVSNHLFDRLPDVLGDLHLTRSEYEESFIRFEYFRSLIHFDREQALFERGYLEPGRFVWQRDVFPKPLPSMISAEIERHGDSWAPLRVGFFDGSRDRAIKMKAEHDELLSKLQAHWW